VDCRTKWPTTRYGERHFFQFGALGGATQEEYFKGSPRVQEYLRRYHSPRRRWNPPEPDGISPEAEWGFAPELGEDIEAFASRHEFRIKRFSFQNPEDLSPLAADFYLWWNRRRGIPETRLIVDSFILMEPYWTVRSGAVPFWMLFNTRPSAIALNDYLSSGRNFEELYLMLFSHGVESVGVVPIHQWMRILAQAPRGDFIGVDEDEYPRDFATFVRYHDDLITKIAARYPIPPAVALSDLESFIQGATGNYQVEWK
jgi:hypothetical protein